MAKFRKFAVFDPATGDIKNITTTNNTAYLKNFTDEGLACIEIPEGMHKSSTHKINLETKQIELI